MESLKSMLHRLLFPPIWLSLLIVPVGFAWVTYVLITGQTDAWQAYLSYILSAYSLSIVCARLPGLVRASRQGFTRSRAVNRIADLPYVRRYRSDPVCREQFSLYSGLLMNLLYSVFHMLMGVMLRSLWSGALAGYYLLLTLMRAELSRYTWKHGVGHDELSEWKRHLFCGVVLLLMNQALGIVVALVVLRNHGFSYPGYTIYIMAIYTFYAVSSAVVNVLRARRMGSPVLIASRAVSLAAALMSILSLETAMLAQFGDADDLLFRQIMTGATGACVCALILAAAAFMIVRSARQILLLRRASG